MEDISLVTVVLMLPLVGLVLMMLFRPAGLLPSAVRKREFATERRG